MLFLKSITLLAILSITTTVQAQIEFSARSTSSSSSFNLSTDGTATFEFQNTPLSEVFDTLGVGSNANVLVDQTVGDALETTVSLSSENVDLEQAVTSLLSQADLRVVSVDAALVITATKEGEEIALPVRSLTTATLERKIETPVRLMMRHTPLDMVIRFAGGMSGLDIQLDEVALRRAGIDLRTPVSIRCQDEPLRGAMNAMLEQHGLVLEIVGDVIVVTTPDESDREPSVKAPTFVESETAPVGR